MPLHPQIQALVDGLAAQADAPATHEQTPNEARAGYLALAALLGPGEEVANVSSRSIPGPAGDLPVRVYTPSGAGPFGVLVFYHGGGWTIGDLDSHDRECRALCNGAGCVLVSVGYRLAPEHPFPAAVDDAFAALCWVGEHAGELEGDPSRIAVAGDSAGGNLAAVVAMLARDAGGPLVRLQVLVYPAVDLRSPSPHASMEENAAGPFLLKETVEYFTGFYVGADSSARSDVKASPLLATSHADLPPALIVTAELDPLRDEGEAYAAALEKAGVPVTLHRYDGMPHIFFQLGPVVDDSKALLAECAAALRRSGVGR